MARLIQIPKPARHRANIRSARRIIGTERSRGGEPVSLLIFRRPDIAARRPTAGPGDPPARSARAGPDRPRRIPTDDLARRQDDRERTDPPHGSDPGPLGPADRSVPAAIGPEMNKRTAVFGLDAPARD